MMQEAWEGLDDGELLNKQSVNSLIGLMAIGQDNIVKHNCSLDSSGMPEDATLQSLVQAEDKLLYNFVTATRLLSNSSYRPIHDLCLSSEAAKVGKLLYVLKSARTKCFELKTDSVFFQPLKRRPIGVSIIKYRDLDTLRAQHTDTPGITKLNQYCLCSHVPSDRPVFRCGKASENDKLKNESSKPP